MGKHGACRTTLGFSALHGFSLFDAEFYSLFDGVIFKIDILQIFKIRHFFRNALGRTNPNEIIDSCSPPKFCTVVVECH